MLVSLTGNGRKDLRSLCLSILHSVIKTFETLFLETKIKILFSSVHGVGYRIFSLNDCFWLSEDADIFEEQQSKKKTDYSDVHDLGDCMLCVNDCLCIYYCSNALNIHMR